MTAVAVGSGLLVAGGALTASASAAGRAPVSQGAESGVLQGATLVGATASSAPVRITVVLKARNLAALEAKVTGGAFHRGTFLSVSQFANQYGQTPQVVALVNGYFRSHGFATSVFPDRLGITATGTAADADKLFAITLRNYRIAGRPARHGHPAVAAQIVHGSQTPATLPSNISQYVLTVLGLTNYHGAFVSQALPAALHHTTSPATVLGPPPGMLTPASFLKLYDGNGLQTAAHGGAGQTIGIVTFAALPVQDVYRFWGALHIPISAGKVTVDNVDGGPGAASLNTGSDETALDVEQSGSIAPAAHVIVYQAPNSDTGTEDAFLTAASANKADSVSMSWGESETYIRAITALGQESTQLAQAENEPLLELAAQGQSMFDSSGDSAAYDASGDIGATNLSVDNIADSPYATAAGGTTLSYAQDPQNYPLPDGSTVRVVVPAQRTWGWDYLWPEYKQFGQLLGISGLTEQQWAMANVVGSGGGSSTFFAMPSYQRAIAGIGSYAGVHYLTPNAFTNVFPAIGTTPLPFQLPSGWATDFTPSLVGGTVAGRLVPDISTNADPQTGYAVYTRLFKAAYGANWVQYGGTSFVAPQLNGVSALIEAASGGRVGFWNPVIYRAATGSDSPFTPLDAQGSVAGTKVTKSGSTVTFTVPGSNNIFYTGRPGTKYNMGSGLGVPNLARLARLF